MPPGALHQAVEEFMIEEVEIYLRKACQSKERSVSQCARRIKWLRDRPLRRVKHVDSEDACYVPPSRRPLTPERPRKSSRQAMASRRAREAADVTTSFDSSASGLTDRSTDPQVIQLTTEQHYPDSSWAWKDLATNNFLERPVVLEIAQSQSLHALERETLRRISRYPISSLIGIDLNHSDSTFHGHGRLEKGATYALAWHTESETNSRTGVSRLLLNTEMIHRVLTCDFEMCEPRRFELLALEEFVPSADMDLLMDQDQDVEAIRTYPKFILDVVRLRKAVMDGYEEAASLEAAASVGPTRMGRQSEQIRREDRRRMLQRLQEQS